MEKGDYFDTNSPDKYEDCEWWLRTPGMESHRVCLITTAYGEPGTGGIDASASHYVRPMLWVTYKNNEAIKKVSTTDGAEISRIDEKKMGRI